LGCGSGLLTRRLIDTSRVPELLRRHGVDAELRPAFTDGRPLPDGLVAVTGTKG
jgi:hypothetical protein